VSVTTIDPYAPDGRDTALWSVAALVVAAAHVGVVVSYMLLRPAPEGIASAPAIDVAFMPATSLPAPAAPDAQQAQPAPPVEQSDMTPPTDASSAPREIVAEPAPPSLALTTPEPLRAPAPTEEPTAALPPPATAIPLPDMKKPVAVPERAAHKPVKDDKAEKEKHKAAPSRAAAAPASQPARMASAPSAGADSEGAQAGQASWNSELAAHIRRYATYSAGGSQESGTVQISVTIDRSGRLLSHRLAGSSGSSTLDRTAMAIIERAQPFPRFPPGMTQAQVARTIPLHLRPQ
jgi:protein TonB